MAVSHIKSNPIADMTGTVTVFGSNGSTQTVAATDLVRPSDWNSAHNQYVTIAGNTAGQSTFSGSNIVFGGGPNITLSGVNATRFDISAGAGGAGDGVNILAAGTQTANTTGTVAFVDSNGIAWGMSNSSQITASYSQSTHAHNLSMFAVSNTTQSSSGTQDVANVSFAGAGAVSVGVSNGSVVVSAPNTIAQSNQTVGGYFLGNTTGESSSSTWDARTVSFEGAGIVSVGASAGSIRISATQSNQAFSADASSTFQTLSFQNSNGFTFSNNGGAIRASYSVPVVSNAIASVGSATNSGTNTSRFAADDHVHAGVFSVGVSTGGNTTGDTRVDVGRFVLAGSNAVTLSQATAANALNTIHIQGPISATTISAVASANTVGSRGSRFALEDHQHEGVFSAGVSNDAGNTSGDTRVGAGRFVFRGGNNVTLSQITAANALNTVVVSAANQTNQSAGIYAVGNTTGQSSSSTYDARTLSIDGAGIVSVGWSNSTLRVSATQSNQAFSAAGGSSAFQTLGFSDNAFASFTNSNGSVAITELRGSFYAVSNTTQSTSMTQNLDALSFAGAGIASVGVSNGSVLISVPAGGGGGDGGVFAGVSNLGNTAGSTGTVSTGNLVLVGSNGVTLSQSTAGAGSHATVSIIGRSPETISSFMNVPVFNQTMTFANASISHCVAFQLPEHISASFLRIPVVMTTSSTTLATTAATLSASAEIYSSWNAVIYSMGTGANSNSLQSVASGSAGFTQQNSISVAANGTQYSVTQGYSGQALGAGTTRTTQYSISNTNYSFTTNQIATEFSGTRFLDIPFANSLTPGPYWLVFGGSTSSTANSTGMSAATNCNVRYSNHFGMSNSNVVVRVMGNTDGTSGGFLGAGSMSTGGATTTASIQQSRISSSASHVMLYFQLIRSA